MLTFAALLLLADAPPACAYDRTAMLALTPDRFDQDMKGGWRPLGDKPACRTVAADLLRVYREANWGKMKPFEVHISYWHEGQLRALAGDGAKAVPLLLGGVDPNSLHDFADYALGTVAFLQRDREALTTARSRLSALPRPADWAKTEAEFQAKLGFAPQWPPNLNVLDGLVACFDKPYAQAYASPCTQSFKVTKLGTPTS